MHCVSRLFGSCVLASLLAHALPAVDEGARLAADHSTQSLHVQSLVHGHVFLALGAALAEPFQIGGIALDVMPEYVLYLGEQVTGRSIDLSVPRGLRELSVEAIVFDAEHFALFDSNVVQLADVFADLIEATFHAELIATDGIPSKYSVVASLMAPETGYEFMVDGFELSELTMDVYLRLVEPGDNEINIPVLTHHRQAADLGSDIGKVVRVHLMRQRRGDMGPQVYRLMVELPVAER